MGIEVVPDEILKRPTDNRGRIHLGPDYADKTVTVAILDAE